MFAKFKTPNNLVYFCVKLDLQVIR